MRYQAALRPADPIVGGERPRTVPKDRLREPNAPVYRCGVQLLPQNRSTIWYMALVVLLVSGLAIGVALFVLQARGPVADPEFTVASPQGPNARIPNTSRFSRLRVGQGC